MMNFSPIFACDGYKLDHRRQYPKGTEYVYSNLTPRGSRVSGVNEIVFFGLQYFLNELQETWNYNFFMQKKSKVVSEYAAFLQSYLGPNTVGTEHIAALHDLGYLPVRIKAVKEGTLVPMRVPCLTIENTHPDFFWVTNFLETTLSTSLWGMCTSATTAFQYRKVFEEFHKKTVSDATNSFTLLQGHDFSYRGLPGVDAAAASGAAHLTSFVGTDTLPAILFLDKYYSADSRNNLVGTTVSATEHSVMCLSTAIEGEYETFKRLISEVYPSGIVSIVSDSFDFWAVVTDFLPKLKDVIMARDGKLVIRPDSGNPVDILCGTVADDLSNNPCCGTFEEACDFMKDVITESVKDSSGGQLMDVEASEAFQYDGKYYNLVVRFDWKKLANRHYINSSVIKGVYEVHKTAEQKGLIECLWDIFGGTVTEKGYKVLDSHIGAIYGDSITLERQKEILTRLQDKGFASSNVVLGIGSYSYQYVTRDTYGFAVKATAAVVDGVEIPIFKKPKTDDGLKNSAKGYLAVFEDNGKLRLKDELSRKEAEEGCLEEVFLNGNITRNQTLSDIRNLINANLQR